MSATGTKTFLLAGFFLTSGGIPEHARAVLNFDLRRYLGRWYEIARLDYFWEKNLDNVTATYSLKENGDVKVDNKGWDYKQHKWKESVGKAKPVGDPKEAKLKVSFFGPFYAGYNVIALDKDYQYALVIGGSTDYMWILSRMKTMPEEVKNEYVEKARALGYPVDKLIWVKQDR
jgi:apolipoprotein D and lipocalin family protein